MPPRVLPDSIYDLAARSGKHSGHAAIAREKKTICGWKCRRDSGLVHQGGLRRKHLRKCLREWLEGGEAGSGIRMLVLEERDWRLASETDGEDAEYGWQELCHTDRRTIWPRVRHAPSQACGAQASHQQSSRQRRRTTTTRVAKTSDHSAGEVHRRDSPNGHRAPGLDRKVVRTSPALSFAPFGTEALLVNARVGQRCHRDALHTQVEPTCCNGQTQRVMSMREWHFLRLNQRSSPAAKVQLSRPIQTSCV